MNKVTKHRKLMACLLAIAATTMVTPAHAWLASRDIDGDGIIDAFYDDGFDITWLRNANVNGPMNWSSANAWANNFSIGSYSDWRLPTALNHDGSGPCDSYCNGSSEMLHLRDHLLGGNNAVGLQNLQRGAYWTGTSNSPIFAWGYTDIGFGRQGIARKSDGLYAMAVRNGDVVSLTAHPSSAVAVQSSAGITVREDFYDIGTDDPVAIGGWGHTRITVTNSSQSNIAMFAITNPLNMADKTTRAGWRTYYRYAPINKNEWDNSVAPSLGLGTFASSFGNASDLDYVHLYWTDDAAQYGIGSGDSSNEFTIDGRSASEFVAWDKNKQVIAQSFHVSGVPEPETYAMLLAGLGLVGAIARRRKGAQA